MLSEIVCVEGLYSKLITINLIYTPELFSSQSIIGRNVSEHRHTNIGGFGS